MSSQRVWFITGTSSGFGRLLTELVLSKGECVVATLLEPNALDKLKGKHPSNQLLVLKLDVTKPEEVSAGFNKIKEIFGQLDVVVNNAGCSVVAEIEGTPEDAARSVFDTNFWGAVNVNKGAVKFFKDINQPGRGGRLLVTNSMSALNPIPTVAFYSASKYVIDRLTNALALELDPEWNIKITILEPGSFDTPGRSKAANFSPHRAYTKPALITSIFRKVLLNTTAKRGNTSKAVERIYDLAGLADPLLRLVLGYDAIKRTRAQHASIAAEIDKYESWSKGLAPEA